jgi:hypothetical protein
VHFSHLQAAIRRVAQELGGHLAYAMRVEKVLSLEQYAEEARSLYSKWSHRIPNLQSADMSERLGGCIYDYSSGAPLQRPSVHGPLNQETDLAGKNVLISWGFYYFGNQARRLPESLLPIQHQTQGHRNDSNANYFNDFVDWLGGLKLTPGQLYGWPDFIVDWGRGRTKWRLPTSLHRR